MPSIPMGESTLVADRVHSAGHPRGSMAVLEFGLRCPGCASKSSRPSQILRASSSTPTNSPPVPYMGSSRNTSPERERTTASEIGRSRTRSPRSFASSSMATRESSSIWNSEARASSPHRLRPRARECQHRDRARAGPARARRTRERVARPEPSLPGLCCEDGSGRRLMMKSPLPLRCTRERVVSVWLRCGGGPEGAVVSPESVRGARGITVPGKAPRRPEAQRAGCKKRDRVERGFFEGQTRRVRRHQPSCSRGFTSSPADAITL